MKLCKYAIFNTLATITLNASIVTASPGDRVTYTCTVTDALTISWTVDSEFLLQFTPATQSDQRMQSCSDVSTIQCAMLDFQAVLTDVGQVVGGLADLTSTLSFNATINRNQTVVECRGVTASGTETANRTLIVAGMYIYMQ